MNKKTQRVAIVQDWLIGGGAERITEILHEMYPDAPIYTSYCSDEWRERLNNKVVTGYLQRWPFSKLRKFIPFLRIWWFSSLNFDEYDLVVSVSGAEAKGIKTSPDTTHVNYCNAPTHYYWSRYEEYISNPGFGAFNQLARIGLQLLVGPLRRWDYKAAQRPNYIISNSTYIQTQVKKYYNRDSEVIFPPVDTKRFEGTTESRHGFVATGRQTPYKRIDLAVIACTSLNLPLVVIGDGPENRRLRSLAGPTITFITDANDDDVVSSFKKATAFIFPGLDDFGITPVEAMAAGTPVIAYKAGGALDYVLPNRTGLFFDKQTSASLEKVLHEFDSEKFTSSDVKKEAERFGTEVFKKSITQYLDNVTV